MPQDAPKATDILVIGAGPAGLAVAAALARRGRRADVVEQGADVGASWRRHYERLHLHTVKELSALPGLPFPAHFPRYVPRQGVVDYLASYAARWEIAPRLGVEVVAVVPDGGRWRTATAAGETIVSDAVVVATGANRCPARPRFAGEADFAGKVVHSADYRNAEPFAGQRVLVVGMGNSGAEIALDLCEHGVGVAISARSPVNIVYRDVLGRPTQRTSILVARLPRAWGDRIARWFCDVTVGDLSRYGIRKPATSPLYDLRERGRAPVIDVGTLARIKAGDIRVHPGIERLIAGGVRFSDGREEAFDAIVAATGYRAGIASLFPQSRVPVDENGLPTTVVGEGALAGAYFVGFDTRQPGGLLQTIGEQAQVVGEAIAGGRPPVRAA